MAGRGEAEVLDGGMSLGRLEGAFEISTVPAEGGEVRLSLAGLYLRAHHGVVPEDREPLAGRTEELPADAPAHHRFRSAAAPRSPRPGRPAG